MYLALFSLSITIVASFHPDFNRELLQLQSILLRRHVPQFQHYRNKNKNDFDEYCILVVGSAISENIPSGTGQNCQGRSIVLKGK